MSQREPGMTATIRELPETTSVRQWALTADCYWCSGHTEIATFGVAARLNVGIGRSRLKQAASEAHRLLRGIEPPAASEAGVTPIVVGALPFGDRTAGTLHVPRLALWRDRMSKRTWQITVGLRGREYSAWFCPPRPLAPLCGPWPRVWAIESQTSQADWTTAVTQVLTQISAGVIRKLVLARQVVLRSDIPVPRTALIERLIRTYDGIAYVFAFGEFIGASPELLIERRGSTAVSRPMAGSTGYEPGADNNTIKTVLRHSAKDRLEHALVVDAVTNRLQSVAQNLRVSALDVAVMPTVAHLVTNISIALPPNSPSALHLVALLHPTPAIAGLPLRAVLDMLPRLETFDRGLYGGPVGWMDANGDGEWALAIRCASLLPSGLTLRAGAGIVQGSDPDLEWLETQRKLQAISGLLEPE